MLNKDLFILKLLIINYPVIRIIDSNHYHHLFLIINFLMLSLHTMYLIPFNRLWIIHRAHISCCFSLLILVSPSFNVLKLLLLPVHPRSILLVSNRILLLLIILLISFCCSRIGNALRGILHLVAEIKSLFIATLTVFRTLILLLNKSWSLMIMS